MRHNVLFAANHYVTLSPSFSASIERLSVLTGQSKSSLIAEMLEQGAPVLARVIAVLEAAQSAKDELKTALADQIGEAQSHIEDALNLGLAAFEQTGDLFAGIEDVSRRSRKSPKAALSGGLTPPSNRGVRSLAKTSKNTAKSRTYDDLEVAKKIAAKTPKKTAKKQVVKGGKNASI